MTEDAQTRKVRSFVRHGRMTAGQRQALENLSARYLISPSELTDLSAVFGRTAPKYIEIGFGMGASLAASALANPDIDYLGIEVHQPGVGRLLAQLAQQNSHNARVVIADAVDVVRQFIPPQSVAAIFILFPDPWPKKRHHKRRLIQADFAKLLCHVLEPGGRLFVATDWEDYAQHILAVLDATPGLMNVAGTGCYAPRPAERPATKFEQRGLRLGHRVRDFVYRKMPNCW
jgi:tRNA (guanine-N7-)-methyltransferase